MEASCPLGQQRWEHLVGSGPFLPSPGARMDAALWVGGLLGLTVLASAASSSRGCGHRLVSDIAFWARPFLEVLIQSLIAAPVSPTLTVPPAAACLAP